MPARKIKPEVIKTVTRPHGLEAVYERDADGVVTRTVRKATDAAPAAEPAEESA